MFSNHSVQYGIQNLIPDHELAHKQYTEIASEVREVLVMDLGIYSNRFESAWLEQLYVSPRGIYMQGYMEPFIRLADDPRGVTVEPCFTQTEYQAYQSGSRLAHPIGCFEDFIKSNEVIVSSTGRPLAHNPKRASARYLGECPFPYSAIRLLSVDIYQFLISLRPEIQVTINLTRDEVDPLHYFAGRTQHAYEQALNDCNVFHPHNAVIRQVADFVGEDYWNNYAVEVKNTTVIVEKLNDFRIIEYHRRIYEDLEALRQESFGP